MKIIVTEGCMAFDTTIDGISWKYLSKEKYEEVVDLLLKTVKNGILKDNTCTFHGLLDIIPYDTYECDEHSCEQCGDTVSKTTWEIDEKG